MIETSCSSRFNIDSSKDFDFFSFSNNKISLSDAPILQPINIEMAIKSLKSGAFEFIQKPFDQERLLNFVRRAVENYNLKKENQDLQSKLFHSFDLVGSSQNILKINNVGPSLMRECEGLNSLAIELEIKCKTNVLRKFINNCKPPLLINCLNVTTPSLPNTTNNPATLDPFAPPDLATPTPDHLPIVSVVDCVAVITFEYVTSIDFGLADLFSQTNVDVDFSKLSEAFLEATGNDHIITTLKNEKALR